MLYSTFIALTHLPQFETVGRATGADYSGCWSKGMRNVGLDVYCSVLLKRVDNRHDETTVLTRDVKY